MPRRICDDCVFGKKATPKIFHTRHETPAANSSHFSVCVPCKHRSKAWIKYAYALCIALMVIAANYTTFNLPNRFLALNNNVKHANALGYNQWTNKPFYVQILIIIMEIVVSAARCLLSNAERYFATVQCTLHIFQSRLALKSHFHLRMLAISECSGIRESRDAVAKAPNIDFVFSRWFGFRSIFAQRLNSEHFYFQ